MRSTIYAIAVLFICLVLLSCGKQNPLAPPATEVQQGISFTDDKLPIANGEFIYRQGIHITGMDSAVYSYRLSTLSSNLPEGMAADEDGWIYFPASGYATDTPIGEAGANRTIWTTQTQLNLEYHSAGAKLHDLVTKVEVRVKAEDGTITTIESPFKSDRLISSSIFAPFNSGATTGMGIEFNLRENGDIFVDGLYAHHFMYRLNTLDSNLMVTNYGTWYSSIDSRDIRIVQLNNNTTPALGVTPQNAWTQFESYVVSRQGIEEASTHNVYFRAVSGNKPVAKVFPETLVGLGDYHYTITSNTNVSAFYNQIPSNTAEKNRQLWSNENAYHAVNSQDFKLHLRWGYRGQYSNDNPFGTEMNLCYNEQGYNYFSKITAFDLRFDGTPLPSNSGFVNPVIVTHSDGSTWLRILNLLDSCRHVTLSNLSNWSHQFQVCAVDIQGVYSEPAAVSINLIPYKPFNQRSGILIVDDSPNSTTYSPEQTVDNIYNSIIPNTWGAVTTYDIAESGTTTIAPGFIMLQDYKAVVWHSDNPSSSANLLPNIDALDCYLAHSGNLVLSGTNRLYTTITDIGSAYPVFIYHRLGITNNASCGYVGNSITTNPFFVQANGLNGLGNVSVETDASFCSLVNTRKGLSIVTYFNPDLGLNFLYGFGCKPVNSTAFPPTQEQYDMFSSKYVAYKYSQLGANVVVFGFPLSYMKQTELSPAIQNILGGIMSPSMVKGGAK
jgi:hypothetical protein